MTAVINTPETPEKAPASAKKPILQLVGVKKVFGDFAAVDGISLDIRDGEFVTIVGPSGSGKTTLLRMLAGLEAPSSGNISLHGELMNNVPPNKRPTCLVFQSLALFPHKTVGDNIEFPLKVKKVDPEKRKARALELLRMVRLPESYYSKNVMQCSGGERQRVALARAFAYDPEVLFFDEPLSALDYKLKKILEKEFKDLHRQSGKTFVYITHSLEEAMVMSDRIGVMRAGKVVQIGTPEEIYARPVDRFVAEFFGEVNLFSVTRDGYGKWNAAELAKPVRLAPGTEPAEGKATVVVRPENMRFATDENDAENVLPGTLFNEYALGSRIQYQVRAGKKTYLIELPRSYPVQPGPNGDVLMGWDSADAIVVEA